MCTNKEHTHKNEVTLTIKVFPSGLRVLLKAASSTGFGWGNIFLSFVKPNFKAMGIIKNLQANKKVALRATIAHLRASKYSHPNILNCSQVSKQPKNNNETFRSFKSKENIHKKEVGPNLETPFSPYL